MIKEIFIKNCCDDWDYRLFIISGILGIYKNTNKKVNKLKIYQVYLSHDDISFETKYFKTFKKAVESAVTYLKTLKDFNKYIPDIMRLTALIKEEES